MTGLRYISEADVSSLVSLPDVIDALDDVLGASATGMATNIPKAMAAPGPWSIHSLGSYDSRSGLAAFKSWINAPSGAQALTVLFDLDAGAVVAIIEAGMLGALRTAAVTAVATRELAAADADSLALIGTGRQAYMQLAAVIAARPLRTVAVWSPNEEHRTAFAARASKMFELPVQPAATLEEAVTGAPIVLTVTRATEPFLDAALLDPGSHLNAVGAILPGAAEVTADVLVTSDHVVVDDVEAAFNISRELQDAAAADPEFLDRVVPLSDVQAARRHTPDGRTALKSVGMGLSDLAAATAVWRRAQERQAGQLIERTAPGPPQWRRATTTGA